MEIWSRAAGIVTCRSLPQELWSSRGMLRARGRRGVEVRRCAVGVQTWRRRGVEPWWSGDALQAFCLFASRALEMRCRRCLKRGMELWRMVVVVGMSSE